VFVAVLDSISKPNGKRSKNALLVGACARATYCIMTTNAIIEQKQKSIRVDRYKPQGMIFMEYPQSVTIDETQSPDRRERRQMRVAKKTGWNLDSMISLKHGDL
jgi:hypothetical protein